MSEDEFREEMRRLRRFTLVALILILIVWGFAPTHAAGIPLAAEQHRAELVRNVHAVAGLDAPVSLFAGQVHQESGWKANVRSPVGAEGLAQFMPATARWISNLFPELSANSPYNPSWALRALVTYDVWLFDQIQAANACERWAFSLSAYNGGLGWVNRDKSLASRQGRDSLTWFGSVDAVNAGRSTAAWKENRAYPRTIIYTRQPLYVDAGWGAGVCL